MSAHLCVLAADLRRNAQAFAYPYDAILQGWRNNGDVIELAGHGRPGVVRGIIQTYWSLPTPYSLHYLAFDPMADVALRTPARCQLFALINPLVAVEAALEALKLVLEPINVRR